MHFSKKHILTLTALGLGLVCTLRAPAETIAWATWNSATAGSTTPGTAVGTMTLGSGVTVTYTGQINGLEHDTDWGPSGTYAGKNVSNAPPSANVPWMTGGQTYTETITFSQAVTDPTMAFWSLGGQNNITSSYNFANGELFSIQACGPSDNLGGGCIAQNGQILTGDESNGTIQFAGTYSSLSFTTPTYEYWWDFTVGAHDIASVTPPPPVGVTPEPSSLALLGMGLASIAGLAKRRIRRS